MTEFDAIIVGGGHNGLGIAAYLSKSGLKVLVCEAFSEVGGYLHSESVIPGYIHSFHAITMGTYAPIYRDFDLLQYGTRMIRADVEFGLIVGTKALALHNSVPKANFKTYAKFSEKDARTLESLHKRFHTTWLKEYYSPPMPPEERGVGLQPRDRDEWRMICSMSPAEVVENYFESEMIRLFLTLRVVEEGAEGYAIASKRTKNEYKGTGDYAMKMLTDPQYAIPQGGSRRLAEGLSRIISIFGGVVLVDAVVKRIIVKDGRAIGVELLDGRVFNSGKMVISNVDIGATIRLTGEENFGPDLVKKINSLKAPAWGKFDLHIASNESPKYKVDDPAINRSLNVFVGYESVDDLDKHTDEARKNQFPKEPSFHAGCQTLYDTSLAPPGKHTLWEWMYISPQLSMETTESIAQKYKEAVLARWQEFAPNLKGETMIDVYPYYVRKWRARPLLPSISNGQYYDNRPISDLSGYRTPVSGLYLCHSSSHPGATVRFGPCYNALTVIARDFNLAKWWSDPVPGVPLASE
ncbi:MAG: NAD(P)/FAD-dependent oxidoreductase [Nitrososphaerota archaeon]|jgi:phytoene dehydrogenase-like protein|nr:NAD(P)/FAD-dependent oxidoreductase [Nitrososphaerota archaeon]MDG6923629.1 NAD(P)/FAD-dependent oxidoreductase [Nitrososphaerota archaeon]